MRRRRGRKGRRNQSEIKDRVIGRKEQKKRRQWMEAAVDGDGWGCGPGRLRSDKNGME
jgi:hypothetical protein